MECNKDEATRAKELAERKFVAKDINGAKKFALKAQNLYPGLEGIPQMIATLDVHISAENKINGEADWYAILDVNPQADDEAVRKQYRKLALMLHPDKNKSVGADGAFKLISEAWSLLSDKAKRVAYDQKRSAKVIQKVSTPSGSSTASKAANGFHNITKTTSSSVRASKSNQRAAQSSTTAGRSSNLAGQSSSSHKPKPNTFWTVCHRCKMQYEYLRVYLNHNLLCPNCHEPFLAVETAPPTTSTPTPWKFSQQRQNPNSQAANKSTNNSGRNHASSSNVAGFSSDDSYGQNNVHWGPFSRTGGASSAAQAASVVQQAYEKVRREREEAQAAIKREEAMRRKHHASKRASVASSTGYTNAAKRRRGMEDSSASTHGTDITHQMGVGNGGPANLSGSKLGSLETGWINGTSKYNNARDISQVEIQSLLVEKAKREIRKKLHEWNSMSAAKTVSKDIIGNENANEKQSKSFVKNDMQNENKSGGFVDKNNGDHCLKTFPGSSGVAITAETLEAMSINVPDPDFHDFDKDRTERSFEDNQVWAAYDDDDGMPRYYAMIHNVISLNPFKMQISWLNSKTNSELGPLNWVGSGFSKTCGEFRIGRHEINSSLNSFSHKVKWTKGMRGAIRIYPRKGDVWAIYRNWSPDWNELTADEVIHKYDMVEVLDDYNEELGVTVTPLVKVAGFKTVFHRHLDHREIKRIPREEMFRFSHQVPSYLLTGQEAPNAPKGCRELDPAATPVELLQVLIGVKEEEILENDKKINEENVVDVGKANDRGVVVNCEKAR
ncbi:uncharacterized protein LOC111318004 [Durio zibethinus]|uniref:Uncharacterized protein LOC111318004 n=1 Tax=Durio zibethinus TaxID=66656 RepID=A0A6P6BGW8_DURZI|nr:uncharacterized protein LOC111318004 [Durio zibethinus]XP_022776340.1 uncharacterized protein LOC111318004 [Durio zibethinus]XP_022776341.1 uncharacterized protein LOC111318004 [Durio zibethinus]XP_022776343.1 uncharacterized protein LOC111318004 [Durio zibethinus]XP_022776344.1 uncharacterized protein LOC111318004 [Durio zibethinus]